MQGTERPSTTRFLRKWRRIRGPQVSGNGGASLGLGEARPRTGRGRLLRRSGMTLASAWLVLFATGCHVLMMGASSGQAGGQPQGDGQQITVAVVPGFENAPLQVGIKDG